MDTQTVDFLEEVYRNARQGAESLDILTPKADDAKFKQAIQKQHEGFADMASKAMGQLAELGKNPKESSPMTQVSMWGGIQMNTMFDKSPDHLAQMVIQGNNQGIMDLTRQLKKCDGADAKAKKLGEDLMKMEEKYVDEMKQFLN